MNPEDIRVLAVDDNVVCLTLLTALLNKCRYQVTSTRIKAEALAKLQQNLDNFDIVLTNVNMDEMDGFKLLEAGLELDIPVIMISASESRDIIMNGIRHGAVDYLIKPVRLEAIKTIWQHVYRKKHLPRDVIPNDNFEDTKFGIGMSDNASKRYCKRKITVEEDNGATRDEDNANQPTAKKERIRWSKELHAKFLDAVHKLGGPDKAVPKKILDFMNEPDVTREKVASHLQKYRRYLKKNLDNESSNKTEQDNHNYNPQLSSHPLMPQFSTCSLEPTVRAPTAFNHTDSMRRGSMEMPTSFAHMDTIRQGLYGRSCYPQEIDNIVYLNPQQVIDEAKPLQIVPYPMGRQQSTMLNSGTLMGSSSNFFPDQPVSQHPAQNFADSRFQTAEEVLDHGPDPPFYDYPLDTYFDVNSFAPFGGL